MSVLKPHSEGTEVLVWVVPGASKNEIVGLHGGSLRVRVAAPPEGGRANKAVERILTTATGARVRLLSGMTARKKRVLVEGLSVADVKAALSL
jgi:uncharacterized protein